MKQTEYEQKKRECWEEFCIKNPAFNDMLGRKIFNQIYDRAYALGKQIETISSEDIGKASEEYAINVNDKRLNTYPESFRPQLLPEYEMTDLVNAFAAGVSFALGKQEKDGEDTVIQGWVCRDNNSLNAQVLIGDKPKRTGYGFWENKSADCITLSKDSFPDLTWELGPLEVELIIKRKKNG